MGLPHPHWFDAVTAFVTLKVGASADAGALIEHCKARLDRHEFPKTIVFLDKLPATATGKVQKHVLRAEYRNYYAAAGAGASPANGC